MSDNIITLWYFEFRSKPSLITVICMDPHSPNKLIATKCCFLKLGDDTNFLFVNYFFVFRFFLFVFINFYKNYFIIIILFIWFFFFMKIMKIIFIFPCFGMLRYVPACSGFYRRPFHTHVDRIFSISSKLSIANKCVQFVQIYNNDPRSIISTSC